ncbi:MAG: helix-turn-helix transcriptional regulator [Treponema sp.]|nr:helix-turn-helix transcriptional regulator [Treponema sp.]
MMIFESQVLELQLLVDQYLKENAESSFRAKNDIVNRAVKYLQQNYSNPAFSVDELAGNVCVSRAHLSRVFKAYTMESVHEYLTDLRLQKCRQLIAEGHSILDSSIESGFSDYTSFVKTFKKMYGMTPQQFRKNLLEEIKKGTGKK